MIGEDFELEAIRAVAVIEGEPDLQRRVLARSELAAMIAVAETADVRTSSPRRRPPQRFPIRALGISAVSSCAAAAVVVVLLLGRGGAVEPASAVAAILGRAADATSLVTPIHLRPGQVWYVEQAMTDGPASRSTPCKRDCYETRMVRWWVGPNRYSMHTYVIGRSRQFRLITHAPPNVPLTPARYSARWSGVGGGYDRIFHYKLMLTTSTSPAPLRRLLLHPPGVRGIPARMPRWEAEQVILGSIQGILLEPRVPARMLSGLYRLLATIPGATLKGAVTDTLGRHAIEVDYRLPLGPRIAHEAVIKFALLFDPKTYVLLDTNGTNISRTTKFPSSYWELSYVNSGIVHHIGGLPTQAAQQG